MSELFMLVGGSLFLTGASIYLTYAFHNSRGMAIAAFMLPPVAWFYFGNQRLSFRWAAYLQMMGIGMLFVAVLFWLSADGRSRSAPKLLTHGQHPELRDTPKRFSRNYRTRVQAARLKISEPLRGELNGYPFFAQSAQYIDGVLRLTQRGGYYAVSEVSIFLEGRPLKEWSELLVSPGDNDAPVIHVSWTEPGNSVPETKIYTEGYSLDLQVEAIKENLLYGQMALILPDAVASFFVGTFGAHLSHLRYVDGDVDRRWDSQQTLQFVVQKYFKNHYEFNGLRPVQYSDVSFVDAYTREPKSALGVVAANEQGLRAKLHFQFVKREEGWQVDSLRSDFSGLRVYSHPGAGAKVGLNARNILQRREGGDSTPNLSTSQRFVRSDHSEEAGAPVKLDASLQLEKSQQGDQPGLRPDNQVTVSLEQLSLSGAAGGRGPSPIAEPLAADSSASALSVGEPSAQGSSTATASSNTPASATSESTSARSTDSASEPEIAGQMMARQGTLASEGGGAAANTSFSSSQLPTLAENKNVMNESAVNGSAVPGSVSSVAITAEEAPIDASFSASNHGQSAAGETSFTQPSVDGASQQELSASMSVDSSSIASSGIASSDSGAVNLVATDVSQANSTPEASAKDIALQKQREYLQPYLHKLVSVTPKKGRVVKGLFTEIRNQKVVVETRFGGGKVEYFVKLDELEHIELVRSTGAPSK